MKTIKQKSIGILILLLVSTLSVYAANNLSILRPEANTLEVQLNNSDEIFGIQFSLRTSSDVVLGKLQRGSRTTASHWLVASYKPNDSTVNVVIISMESRNLNIGNGAIAKISFLTETTEGMSHACLANVMVTNSGADSLGIAMTSLDWSNKPVSLASSIDNAAKSFVLGHNFPNPFNPTTKISYKLHKAAQVRLSVYDMTGREVNRLIDGYQHDGEYNIDWNSNDKSGQKMASGMYFARLMVDNESATRKMVLSK